MRVLKIRWWLTELNHKTLENKAGFCYDGHIMHTSCVVYGS